MAQDSDVGSIGTLVAELQLLSRARDTNWWGDIATVVPF